MLAPEGQNVTDQAEGLRRQRNPKPVKVLAVTGGKGGVGKTNICANLAIVGGDDRAPPVAPAEIGCGERRRCRRFVRPCKKTIGLAECMLRNARPLQDLQRCALRDQRAGGQLPTLSVTPASRENAAARRLTGDDGKGASILLGDGIRVKHRARQDVGRYQWVLGRAARPRARCHAEQAHPGTRRTCKVARRAPDSARAWIASIGQPQVL